MPDSNHPVLPRHVLFTLAGMSEEDMRAWREIVSLLRSDEDRDKLDDLKRYFAMWEPQRRQAILTLSVEKIELLRSMPTDSLRWLRNISPERLSTLDAAIKREESLRGMGKIVRQALIVFILVASAVTVVMNKGQDAVASLIRWAIQK